MTMAVAARFRRGTEGRAQHLVRLSYEYYQNIMYEIAVMMDSTLNNIPNAIPIQMCRLLERVIMVLTLVGFLCQSVLVADAT